MLWGGRVGERKKMDGAKAMTDLCKLLLSSQALCSYYAFQEGAKSGAILLERAFL